MYGLFLLNEDGERASIAYATSDSKSVLEALTVNLKYWIILRLEF